MDSIQITPVSEFTCLILGILATIALGNGAISFGAGDGWGDIASLLMIFLHFLLITIALPFLLRSINRIPTMQYFSQIIISLSIFNVIFMIVTIFRLPNKNSIALFIFGILALIELLPLLLIQRKKK